MPAGDYEKGWPHRVAEAFPAIIAAGVLGISGLLWSISKDIAAVTVELRMCREVMVNITRDVKDLQEWRSVTDRKLAELETHQRIGK